MESCTVQPVSTNVYRSQAGKSVWLLSLRFQKKKRFYLFSFQSFMFPLFGKNFTKDIDTRYDGKQSSPQDGTLILSSLHAALSLSMIHSSSVIGTTSIKERERESLQVSITVAADFPFYHLSWPSAWDRAAPPFLFFSCVIFLGGSCFVSLKHARSFTCSSFVVVFLSFWLLSLVHPELCIFFVCLLVGLFDFCAFVSWLFLGSREIFDAGTWDVQRYDTPWLHTARARFLIPSRKASRIRTHTHMSPRHAAS